MAIFGDLAEMPTPEVLRILGSRTGKLHVRPDLKKQFELHLSEGTVLCFKEDGFSVRDPKELRRGLTALLGLRYGGFEFSQALPTELERHVGPETVLATNTSSLSVAAMAEGLEHPERVVGFHFFNPVAVLPLVEVVRAPRTDDATTATALELAKALKKNAVLVVDAPGFVVNRVLLRFMGEVMAAATPRPASESYGWPEAISSAPRLAYPMPSWR